MILYNLFTVFMSKYYLRPDEVARALGVSRQTIYNYIHEGRLTAIKINLILRSPADKFNEFLNNSRLQTGDDSIYRPSRSDAPFQSNADKSS